MISLLMLTENDREEHSKSTSVVVMNEQLQSREPIAVYCSPLPLSTHISDNKHKYIGSEAIKQGYLFLGSRVSFLK